jgi:predicted lactoylglutathione lyase
MSHAPVIVSLPIADRATSHAFFRDGLGFEPFGELADDGLPEPLQFTLNDGVRVMLIPTDGFGWVIGGREVAGTGTTECIVTLPCATDREVDERFERAVGAGAGVVSAPEALPWGYIATFADPDSHLWMLMTVAG